MTESSLMFREQCKISAHEKVAPGHFVLRFASTKIGKNAMPGQFVQILCADSYEPLLPRPFSFLDASKNDFSILQKYLMERNHINSEFWVAIPDHVSYFNNAG